jgi:NAD(P)-dependent dehydrogenase (short-subunit alcohol dehydrogenase family)
VGFYVDVSDPAQVDSWTKQTEQHFGKLDGAANIAAINGTGINRNRVEETEHED